MIKFKSFLETSLLLIALISGSYAAGSEKVGSSQGVLVYSLKSSSHPSSLHLKSPRGATYRLSLIPDFDIGKHVVVLELVLQRRGRKRDDSNLLHPTGKLHGYQPYSFAASDFARGAQNSIYGDLRVIDLRELQRMFLTPRIEQACHGTADGSEPDQGNLAACVSQVSGLFEIWK